MGSDRGEQATPLLPDDSISSIGDPRWQREEQTSYVNKAKMILILIVAHVALLRPKHIRNVVRRLGYAFVPQLLRSRIWQEHAPPLKQFSTSYLNGLRGCTALKVFTFHYIHALSDIGFQPYGTNERHKYVLELPIIRYFYSGFTSHIFFGVAGYLTSVRLLQMMDSADPVVQAKALATVSSSLFRRAFRLYLPVFMITLLSATWIYTGLYEHWRPFLLDRKIYFPGDWNETKPPMYSTYAGQLQFWGSEMYELTNICTEKTVYPFHDEHLWSILSEMRASLHLSGCLLALAQCRQHVRLVLLFALTGVYFYWNHWEIWVYILGAAAAQIDILLTQAAKHKQQALPSSSSTSTSTSSKSSASVSSSSNEKAPRIEETKHDSTILSHHLFTLPSTLRASTFALAFYFLSYPIDGSRDYAPGYMTLNKMIPDWMDRKDKFYPNIGTFMLILLLVRSDPQTSRWRRFLTMPIPQYMGSISFGFYLVHGPIMHFWGGYMIPQYFWLILFGVEGGGDTTDAQWLLGVLVGWSITLVLSLWMADVWTREVEGRCVRLVKWLEKACFRGKG